MSFNPLVSIVIPVYNGSNYLKEAINSALAQTYRNIEIIVVNDGSNDNGATREIALSYGQKIRYFEKPNGGVASALNLGIQNMKGEYFSWLSHDDLYYPNKIDAQLEFYKKGIVKNDTILYSNYTIIKASGKIQSNAVLDQALLKFKKLYGLYRGCLNGCTLLIPKSILDNLGGFDEKLKYTQDYDLWFRASENYNFYHIPYFLVKTRIHKKQDSRKRNVEAEKEANLLWINMVKNISPKNLSLLEETQLRFYRGMIEFISKTPYHEAKLYYESKINELSLEQTDDLVSVIVPFYNDGNRVINALESIKNQSYKNLEIILVNDGSVTDLKSLNDYCNENKIAINNISSNQGPAHARNYGMQLAKGNYFAFLDSDDLFEKEKLSFQIAEMKRNGSFFSHTSYFRNLQGKKSIIKSGLLNGFVLSQLIYKCTIATPTVVINRRIYDDGFRFNESIKLGEDVCAWLTIGKKYNLLGIDRPLTTVNAESNSASQDTYKQTIGLSNIYNFIISDSELRYFHHEIGLLLNLLSLNNGSSNRRFFPYTEKLISILSQTFIFELFEFILAKIVLLKNQIKK